MARDTVALMAFENWLEGVIAEETGTRRDRGNPATGISDDLGVDGDDAYELLMKLKELSGTDFNEFPYDDYFGSESNMYELVQSIRRLFKGEKKVWLRLSVRNLALYMWEHGGRMPEQASTDALI